MLITTKKSFQNLFEFYKMYKEIIFSLQNDDALIQIHRINLCILRNKQRDTERNRN